mgnify:FL=1
MKDILAERPAHFGPLFGYCHHQVQKLMNRLLRQYDVSPMQCRTLTFLHDAEGEVNQKALEKHLMVKPSTVNGIVDRLEEKEMLRRTTSKTDGRCRILELTDQGMRFYDNFTGVVRHVNTRLERDFTDEEKKLLLSLLMRVARNLAEEEFDPC